MKFELKESTFSILFGIFGIVLVEIAWYALISNLRFPPPDLAFPSVYVVSFTLWGVPSFLGIANGNVKQASYAFLILLIAVATTFALGQSIPVFKTIALAYPGFFAGVALAGTVVLFRRYVIKPKHRQLRWQSLREDLQHPYLKIRYVGLSLLLSALVLIIIYFVVVSSTLLIYGFVMLTVITMIISGYAGKIRKQEMHRKRSAKQNGTT